MSKDSYSSACAEALETAHRGNAAVPATQPGNTMCMLCLARRICSLTCLKFFQCMQLNPTQVRYRYLVDLVSVCLLASVPPVSLIRDLHPFLRRGTSTWTTWQASGARRLSWSWVTRTSGGRWSSCGARRSRRRTPAGAAPRRRWKALSRSRCSLLAMCPPLLALAADTATPVLLSCILFSASAVS